MLLCNDKFSCFIVEFPMIYIFSSFSVILSCFVNILVIVLFVFQYVPLFRRSSSDLLFYDLSMAISPSMVLTSWAF